MSFLSNSIVSCLSLQPAVGDTRALANSLTRLFQLLASPPLVSGSLSLLHCGLSRLFLLHRGGDILETELSSRKVSPAEYVQLDLNTDNTLQSTHYSQHTTVNTLQSSHYNQHITVKPLQSRHYNQHTTVKPLQSRHYNQHITVKLLVKTLQSTHYSQTTTVNTLQSTHYSQTTTVNTLQSTHYN